MCLHARAHFSLTHLHLRFGHHLSPCFFCLFSFCLAHVRSTRMYRLTCRLLFLCVVCDRCAVPQGAASSAGARKAHPKTRASSRLPPVGEDGEEAEDREQVVDGGSSRGGGEGGAGGEEAQAGADGDDGDEFRVPMECYIAMSNLLSFRSSLIKREVSSGNKLTLCKTDVDTALKISSLPEVKASLRKLHVYLDAGTSSQIRTTPGSPGAPEAPATVSGSPSPATPAPASLASLPEAPGTSETCVAAPKGIDDVAVLSHLALTVTRLSWVMLHLLDTLPLRAFSAAPMSSEEDGRQEQTQPPLDRSGQSLGDGCGDVWGEGEVDGSMRHLLGLGVQLMLCEHKKPLIKRLLEANPISYSGEGTVKINRFKAQDSPGALNENSMLAQLKQSLTPAIRKGLGGGERWWRVSYLGEQGTDAGGLFRDSLSALASECQRGADPRNQHIFVCPLFVQVELFQLEQSGTKQLTGAYLVPNPSCDSKEAEDLYEFLGQIMGACARSGLDGRRGAGGTTEKLGLALAPMVWKQLLGREICWDDVAALEPELDAHLRMIQDAVRPNGYLYSESEFNAEVGDTYDFTVSFGGARPYRQRTLIAGGAARKLSYNSRHQYVRLVKDAHMHKYDTQIRAMRRGLLQYLPAAMMPLWNAFDLELAVAGEPEVSIDRLKAEASVSIGNATRKQWFWQCVEEMTSMQRSKLLRFATGRSRLPVGRFYVKEGGSGDGSLPRSATCSFEMYVPVYSSKEVMLRQLLTAIETEDFGNS